MKTARTIRQAIAAAWLLGLTAPAQVDPAIQVHVTTVPSGALVACDGVVREPSPCVLTLPTPGEHLLSAVKDGYRETRRTIRVEAGQRTAVEMKLEPVRGLVLLHSDPQGADVVIDGADRGRTPLLLADLPLGTYRVKITRQGYLPKEVELRIEDRTPVKLELDLTSDSATLRMVSTPPGADVAINGISRGVTPCTVNQVPGGEARIEIALPGYEPFQRDVRLAPGEEQSVTAVLKPLPAELQIVSVPEGARIYLDDQFRGEAPLTLKNLVQGQYSVRAELVGHAPLTRSVNVQHADRLVEELRLQKNCGTLNITTQPAGVKVFVDGREAGTTTVRKGESDSVSDTLQVPLLPAGPHEIELTLKGYFPKTMAVEVEKDKTLILHEKLVRQFIPNYEVRTSAEVFKGVLIEVDPRGDVKLETMPGIYRTIPAGEIRHRGPLRQDGVMVEDEAR